MTKHINVIVGVGRGPEKGIGTFPVNEKQSQAVAESLADLAQARETMRLQNSGVSLERVKFTREYVTVDGGKISKSAAGFAQKGKK